jgi:diguanylate cyclase (GGDEF)-like protein/PAS domain S-box-containing protein
VGTNGAVDDEQGRGAALKALHESEQRLSIFVNNTIEYAIYALDMDGVVTSWNSGAELIKGYTREEALGRYFGMFFTAEDQEAGKPERVLATARSDGRCRDEGWRVRKNGSRFWASVVLMLLRDLDGTPMGFTKITRDETARREAEEAKDAYITSLGAAKIQLDSAHERLRLATDSGRIGIWDWDIQPDVMLWDDWMYRLYGTTRKEGRSGYELWQRHLHPDDRAATEQAVADGVSGVRPYDTEFRIIWEDGSIHHIRGSGSVTRDATGNAMHMIGCNQDVTLLVRAIRAREEQQIRSKRWLELAEQISHVGHWTISVPTQEIFWSDEIYRIYGLDKDVYTPDITSAINAFHPGDREKVRNSMERAIAEKSGFELQARLKRRNGEIRYIVSRGVAQVGEDNEVESIFGVFIDVTQQKDIEKRLRAAKLRVARANAKLKQFALVDSLTGLPNRRSFDRTLDVEFRRAIGQGEPISLIMVDVDFFKGFNDLYGHPAGDRCLRKVAGAIRGVLHRPSDLAARYGGEEMAVVLPNTSLEGASVVARSIVQAVMAMSIEHSKSPESIVTVSCGVAVVDAAIDASEQTLLIERADRALYRAKSEGRNRISSCE